jgi:hypothetical protein
VKPSRTTSATAARRRTADLLGDASRDLMAASLLRPV